MQNPGRKAGVFLYTYRFPRFVTASTIDGGSLFSLKMTQSFSLVFGSKIRIWEEVESVTENLAQEIRVHEEKARTLVAEAKSEAARSLAEARTAAEKAVKEARQKMHREYRNRIQEVEQEADSAAQAILAQGRKDAERYLAESKNRVSSAAAWIVKEVMGFSWPWLRWASTVWWSMKLPPRRSSAQSSSSVPASFLSPPLRGNPPCRVPNPP